MPKKITMEVKQITPAFSLATVSIDEPGKSTYQEQFIITQDQVSFMAILVHGTNKSECDCGQGVYEPHLIDCKVNAAAPEPEGGSTK